MHIMKLQEKYFDYIKYGTKEYEIRLYDEKRKKIKIGEYIEFQKEPLKKEKIIYEVEDLLFFNSFNELVNFIDIKHLASSSEKTSDLLDSLNSFYSLEEQNKYGVVAIKLKKNSNFVIEKNHLSVVNIKDKIFDNIRDNYSNFDKWYYKLSNSDTECYFTRNNDVITSLLILKINEIDSEQIDKKNVLKIRTINVLDTCKGIGKEYLKIADDIAVSNNIGIIYCTCKKNNNTFINFIEKNNYVLYKEFNDEYVYIKEIK